MIYSCSDGRDLSAVPRLPLLGLFVLGCKVFLASELLQPVIAPPENSTNPSSLLASISLVKLLLSLVHYILHYRASRGNVSLRALGLSDPRMNDKPAFTSSEGLSPRARQTSRAHHVPQMVSTAIVAACVRWVFICIAIPAQISAATRDLALIAASAPVIIRVFNMVTLRPSPSFQHVMCLLAGICILQSPGPIPIPFQNVAIILLAVTLFSLHLVITQEYYGSIPQPLCIQNLMIFGVELLVFSLNVGSTSSGNLPEIMTPLLSPSLHHFIYFHGVIEYTSSVIIKEYGAITLAALNCIPLPYMILRRIVAGSESVGVDILIGLDFVSYGAYGVCTLLTQPIRRRHLPPPEPNALEEGLVLSTKSDTFRAHGSNIIAKRWGSFNMLALVFALLSWYMHPSPIPFRQPLQVRSLLSSPLFHDFASDSFLLPQSGLPHHCKRRPLISHRYISQNPRPGDNDTYAHFVGNTFDDTLLIVFFSHARYDINLDSYLEMYTPYFPNVIFVGPGSREERGFNHSYDVVVDSYQSHEDLSDDNHYRMAGRMAHHKLYTALDQHVSDEDCYEGYLWAPFDTFLNVARLLQFNRNKIWYHSPFGVPVPNPALENATQHAPPARISPDPYGNVTEIWKHWGRDWWWGEPHVGLNVCMPAFEKAPLHMRQHLASLTGNETRLIGGSSDTIYFPHRYYSSMKETLGLFLDTNCFLEIALPTVLHLIINPNDHMQFVDHWWIYKPPFNPKFVRQQWKIGYEVDTFHTFHWGDIEGGKFKAHIGIIDEARAVMRESFKRQGFA